MSNNKSNPHSEHRRYRNSSNIGQQRGHGRSGRGKGRGSGGEERGRGYRNEIRTTAGTTEASLGSTGSNHNARFQRKLLTDAINSKDYVVSGPGEAKRLVDALVAFDDKPRLLLDFTDSKNYGMLLINKILEQSEPESMSIFAIPLVGYFLHPDLSKPLLKRPRNTILAEICSFSSGFFITSLAEYIKVYCLSEDLESSGGVLSTFVYTMIQSSMEAIKNPGLCELAQALCERGVSSADKLHKIFHRDAECSELQRQFQDQLLLSSDGFGAGRQQQQQQQQQSRVLTAIDRRPPGGRHNNDMLQYREISIVPTVEEITATFTDINKQDYLPLASGLNRFIEGDPEEHYLDALFRLLRHNSLHPVREAMLQQAQGAPISGRHKIYTGCEVLGVEVGLKTPPSVVLGFHPPQELAAATVGTSSQLSKDKIEDFWQLRSMLSYASLVCLRRQGQPICFATISIADLEWFTANPQQPRIGITFGSRDQMLRCMDEYSSKSSFAAAEHDTGGGQGKQDARDMQGGLDMVVVSSDFFASVNVLRCLQGMFSVPLAEYILPHNTAARPPPEGGPPEYMPGQVVLPQVHYNGNDNSGYDGGISLELNSGAAHFTPAAMRNSTLDESQARALHHALTSRVALIQGPPGTGKTFIGGMLARTILANTRNTRTKILCLCYTNHALDQFLEHLVDGGVQDIVRIGSRTKSERIAQYNLSTLAHNRRGENTVEFRRSYAQLMSACGRLRDEIEKEKLNLELEAHPERVEWHLAQDLIEMEYHTNHMHIKLVADQFIMPPLEEGFNYQRREMNDEAYLWKQWCSGRPAPERGFDDMRAARRHAQQYFNAHHLQQRTPPRDLWSLAPDERLALISSWLSTHYLGDVKQRLAELFEQYSESFESLKELKNESKHAILKDARVIGATTSGAANCKELLESAAAEVVLVEEAGEVLEAHIVTSLTTSVQHLILIGDHKQLRPKVQVYDLQVVSGRGYDLDRSMFERLVCHSGIAPAILTVQRRMRPNISQLIRPTYPDLLDHVEVLRHPAVQGLTKSVLFCHHTVPQESRKGGLSFKNSHEVDICVELARLLLLNGYKPRQLVILTPYLSQLLSIQRCVRERIADVQALVSEIDKLELVKRGFTDGSDSDSDDDEDDDDYDEAAGGGGGGTAASEMGAVEGMRANRGHPRARQTSRSGNPGSTGTRSQADTSLSMAFQEADKKLRTATVDNFQGEESDIVLISLVRSNSDGDVGFLKEPERVNVLLSRAKHGMIIIGNANTLLASKMARPVWKPILDHLSAQGCFFEGIPSYCQRHPTDRKLLRTVDDFRQHRPNGGCTQACSYRMDCGHACEQSCHSVDPAHEHTRCYKPCQRKHRDCGHPCGKLCYEECGRCEHEVRDVPLPCGHVTPLAKCFQCEDSDSRARIKCPVADVLLYMPGCGHEVRVSCAVSRLPISERRCPAKCSAQLECGHLCGQSCHACKTKGYHRKRCQLICERILFCGHRCGSRCHAGEPCPPCSQACAQQCWHSRCPKPCNEVCPTCVETCVWECEHQGWCDLPCGAPCSRLPCNKRCSKLLPCGHQCPTVCGEPCPGPAFCQQCGRHGSQIPDMITMDSYADANLDADPACVLPCGHIFTVSTLDGIMELKEYYIHTEPSQDSSGVAWIRPRGLSQVPMSQPKSCPLCKQVIHSVRRYGRVLNHMALRVSERKFGLWVECQLEHLSHMPNDGDDKLVRLANLYQQIASGTPTMRLYVVLRGQEQMEVPRPPSRPLLEAAVQYGQAVLAVEGNKTYSQRGKDEYIIMYRITQLLTNWMRLVYLQFLYLCGLTVSDAEQILEDAMATADAGGYTSKGCELRLLLVALRFKHEPDFSIRKQRGLQPGLLAMCDWILRQATHGAVSEEQRTRARELKSRIAVPISAEEIRAVLSAMGSGDPGGYNYGGGWDGHWFECPNGHPYFIGECGGAMQQSRCPECGAAVGGASHRLAEGNRQAQGFYRRGMGGGV